MAAPYRSFLWLKDLIQTFSLICTTFSAAALSVDQAKCWCNCKKQGGRILSYWLGYCHQVIIGRFDLFSQYRTFFMTGVCHRMGFYLSISVPSTFGRQSQNNLKEMVKLRFLWALQCWYYQNTSSTGNWPLVLQHPKNAMEPFAGCSNSNLTSIQGSRWGVLQPNMLLSDSI